MLLERLSLLLAALAFGGFGVWLLIQPTALSAVDITLATATARTEIRGFYGGLELGLAVFFTACAIRPEWHRPGLFAQAATLFCIAAGRLVGLAIDGGDTAIVAFMLLEFLGGAIGLFALKTLRRES